LYSSVAPSVGKPSNVRTSFSAPFVNYEYWSVGKGPVL
jgi:hypothetical protein